MELYRYFRLSYRSKLLLINAAWNETWCPERAIAPVGALQHATHDRVPNSEMKISNLTWRVLCAQGASFSLLV